ncbi:MAG: transposase, partial [Cyanobacteriota bacterium]|nr:transposase [Cyanobacteriota bacterium]
LGREEGREQGRRQGLEEGREEQKRDIARNLLNQLNDEAIAAVTGLSLEAIEVLRREASDD